MTEKLVPKLRFNEFHDEWKMILLNSILSFKNGFNASKDKYGFGTKFINVSDILENNYLTYDNIQDYVNVNENELNNYIIEYGDIVFQRSSENREEVGTANVYLGSQPCVYGGFVIRGKKEGKYNPFFLKELLQSTQVRKEITSWSGGSTRYNIGQDSLNKISISLPSIEEQNKIADLLLKVYEKIDLLEYKYKCYKNFKKYLMQQIFTQKLRFDFDEEWNNDTIGNNSEVFGRIGFRGYTVDDLVNKGEGALTIGGKHISKDYQLDLSDPEYLSWEKYEESPEIKIYNNDVLLVKTASVGKVCFIENLNEPATLNPQLIVFKNIKLNNKFFYYYLTSNLFQKDIHKIKSTTGIPTITQKELLNLNIIYPSLEEQEKIVNLLSIVDKKIFAIDKNIQDIKEFKKGLLQQMFIYGYIYSKILKYHNLI